MHVIDSRHPLPGDDHEHLPAAAPPSPFATRLAADMDDYVTKPMRVDALVEALLRVEPT